MHCGCEAISAVARVRRHRQARNALRTREQSPTASNGAHVDAQYALLLCVAEVTSTFFDCSRSTRSMTVKSLREACGPQLVAWHSDSEQRIRASCILSASQ